MAEEARRADTGNGLQEIATVVDSLHRGSRKKVDMLVVIVHQELSHLVGGSNVD